MFYLVVQQPLKRNYWGEGKIKPEFVLFDQHNFRKNYHNVYVFKKFTFPGHKVLKIELSEKQLSGRIGYPEIKI
ncbi:DUF4138 domain-containing protein [Pedobacter sp. AW31-3R]|uniref:DUF4138 domain-containing protein n=1 Tax=Pedobacter sp. AW31-3R TaxID=3445781 RepID=UPI003F9F9CE7